jgi:hypothetical protein
MAAVFWQGVRSSHNMPPYSLLEEVSDTWLLHRRFMPDLKRSLWDTLCLAVCWNLWKERNIRIIASESKPMWRLNQLTIQEIDQWTQCC